jgi:4-hydroxy-tetrahydrodipicolinate reductase
MNVPREHLGGHAFHTYTLDSADKSVHFEFRHNVCGREVYAEGTADAVEFLAKKIEAGQVKVFNMIDVLSG